MSRNAFDSCAREIEEREDERNNLRMERMESADQNKMLIAALDMVMSIDIRGHQLRDRLQFSTSGREILSAVDLAIGNTKGAA